MMKWRAFLHRLYYSLLDLFFVPRCAVCDVRLPLGIGMPLCPICRTQYENDKEATCPVCAGRMSDCFCIPRDLPRCGVHRMVKLVRYRPASGDASAKMIYALKHQNLVDLQVFFAKELALPLSGIVKEPEEWVVTYPPRSRAAKARDGFDHAGALAGALAKQLGCASMRAIVRVGKRSGEQKKNSRTARFENAKESYVLSPQASVAGRRVILVDDVMTTGATMAACARLLRQKGKAKEVVFAVLAKTTAQYVPKSS